ncbi:hypothetical protein AWENTII_000819 [Aspergillus wentii]
MLSKSFSSYIHLSYTFYCGISSILMLPAASISFRVFALFALPTFASCTSRFPLPGPPYKLRPHPTKFFSPTFQRLQLRAEAWEKCSPNASTFLLLFLDI